MICRKRNVIPRILLTSLLSLSVITNSSAQETHEIMEVLRSNECTPKMKCLCLQPKAFEKVANRLAEYNTMQYELEKYKEFSEKIQEKAWYQDDTYLYMITGATFLLGGVLGYKVGTK